jgi:hypothetical protein
LQVSSPVLPATVENTVEIHSGNSEPRRWRALVICLVAGFMTLLDVSIVNVALPSMERGLHMFPQPRCPGASPGMR